MGRRLALTEPLRGSLIGRSFHTSNPLTDAVDGSSRSRLDGSSHPNHRPHALRSPVELLNALDESARSSRADSFPLK